MKKSDMFYSILAVVLLVTIAYLSVKVEIVERVSEVIRWEESDTLKVEPDLNHLPFDETFKWWRTQLGPCGLFEWNDDLYITLYTEENFGDCVKWVNNE